MNSRQHRPPWTDVPHGPSLSSAWDLYPLNMLRSIAALLRKGSTYLGISKIPAVSPLPCLQQGKPLITGVPLLLKLSLLSLLLTGEKIHFFLPLTQPDSLGIPCPPWVLKTKFCKHSHLRAIAFCLLSFMLSLHYHSKPFGKKTKTTQVY